MPIRGHGHGRVADRKGRAHQHADESATARFKCRRRLGLGVGWLGRHDWRRSGELCFGRSNLFGISRLGGERLAHWTGLRASASGGEHTACFLRSRRRFGRGRCFGSRRFRGRFFGGRFWCWSRWLGSLGSRRCGGPLLRASGSEHLGDAQLGSASRLRCSWLRISACSAAAVCSGDFCGEGCSGRA